MIFFLLITSFYLFISPFRNNFRLKDTKITVLSQLTQILTPQLATVHSQNRDIITDAIALADLPISFTLH